MAGTGRGSSCDRGLAARQVPRSGGDGIKRRFAETAEEVVAAFEKLACDRDARAVPADPLSGIEVVLAVGAARTPRGLCGLIERPAQRGRSLSGEMPWGTAGIGLVDGDIQAGVTNGVARVLKAAGVAELSEDRDRGQLPDPVDLIDQRPAAGLLAGVGPEATRRAGRPAGRSRRSSPTRS